MSTTGTAYFKCGMRAAQMSSAEGQTASTGSRQNQSMPNATKVIVSAETGEVVGDGVLVDRNQVVLYTSVADSWRDGQEVTARIERADGFEEVPARLYRDNGFVGALLAELVEPPYEYVEDPLPKDKDPVVELAKYVAEWRRRADSDQPPLGPPDGVIHGPVRWICRVIFRGNC